MQGSIGNATAVRKGMRRGCPRCVQSHRQDLRALLHTCQEGLPCIS
jgi:AhpD family alkylhydroperoxidase